MKVIQEKEGAAEMATSLPATVDPASNTNPLSALNREFAQTLNILSGHAKKGVGVYFQILGGGLIALSFFIRVLSAFSSASSVSDKFTTVDFLIAIGTGLFILLMGGGQRMYEYRMDMQDHRAALEFSRGREQAAEERQKELQGNRPKKA